MSTLEYIVLAVIVILALFLIVRMIRRVAKGESACMFCKSCGDDAEKPSCSVPEESSSKQEDKSETKKD